MAKDTEATGAVSPRRITRQLGEAVTAMVRGFVAADLDLRLAAFRGGVATPTMLVMREIRGTLRTQLDVSRRERFLFVTKRVAWTPLAVQVELRLHAASERRVTRPHATFTLPSVVTPSAPATTLRLRLGEGRVMVLRVGDAGPPVASVGGGTPRRVERWTADWVLGFLDAMVEWRRTAGTERGQVYRLRGDTAGPLHRSLGLVRRSYRAAASAARNDDPPPSLARRDAELTRMSPALGAAFRLADFAVRADAWLDADGRLAVDEDDDRAIKLSFRARQVARRGGEDELRIEAFPPDLVVDGPYHERLYEALRHRADAVRTALRPRRPGPAGHNAPPLFGRIMVGQVEAWLDDPATRQATVFARVARKALDEDVDVALVRGVLGGAPAAFVLQFRVSGLTTPSVPVTDVIPGGVELVAGRRGERTAPIRNTETLGAHVDRLTRTLLAWQRATVPEAAA